MMLLSVSSTFLPPSLWSSRLRPLRVRWPMIGFRGSWVRTSVRALSMWRGIPVRTVSVRTISKLLTLVCVLCAIARVLWAVTVMSSMLGVLWASWHWMLWTVTGVLWTGIILWTVSIMRTVTKIFSLMVIQSIRLVLDWFLLYMMQIFRIYLFFISLYRTYVHIIPRGMMFLFMSVSLSWTLRRTDYQLVSVGSMCEDLFLWRGSRVYFFIRKKHVCWRIGRRILRYGHFTTWPRVVVIWHLAWILIMRVSTKENLTLKAGVWKYQIYLLVQGPVNGHNVLVQRKVYLSERTD